MDSGNSLNRVFPEPKLGYLIVRRRPLRLDRHHGERGLKLQLLHRGLARGLVLQGRVAHAAEGVVDEADAVVGLAAHQAAGGGVLLLLLEGCAPRHDLALEGWQGQRRVVEPNKALREDHALLVGRALPVLPREAHGGKEALLARDHEGGVTGREEGLAFPGAGRPEGDPGANWTSWVRQGYHPQMDRQRVATLFGLAVALIWGLSFLSIKVAVVIVPPMTMAVLRFVIACAVLPLVALVSGESLKIKTRDLPIMVAGGVTGVTLYFLGENNGVALLTASESSLIIGSIPVLTVLSEEVFLKTRVGGRVHMGALVSFLGVALIVAPSLGSHVQRIGYLYMGMAALAWVAYSFLTRGVASRYGKINVIFWQSIFGLLGCVPFALMERHAWKAPGPGVILHLFYLGVVCSAAGYWLYASALDRLGAGRTSVFVNLIPVVSVVGSFFLLGERLGGFQLVGGAVAVLGVYVATVTPGQVFRASAGSAS